MVCAINLRMMSPTMPRMPPSGVNALRSDWKRTADFNGNALVALRPEKKRTDVPEFVGPHRKPISFSWLWDKWSEETKNFLSLLHWCSGRCNIDALIATGVGLTGQHHCRKIHASL